MSEDAKVIQFPKKSTMIFTDRQKERLVTSIKDLTPTPEVAVERIEQDLCAQIVEASRSMATTLGEKLAEKLTKLLFK